MAVLRLMMFQYNADSGDKSRTMINIPENKHAFKLKLIFFDSGVGAETLDNQSGLIQGFQVFNPLNQLRRKFRI